jgi:hypothetical protein
MGIQVDHEKSYVTRDFLLLDPDVKILYHWLNMKLDLKVYLGSMCTAVLLAETPQPPPPPHLGSYMY